MPHATIKLEPGVNQNRTLALNEAAISYTQLVRFIPDARGIGLVQKLGGWTKFFPSNVGSTVRALWAWEDTNSNAWLGVGAQNRVDTITALSATGSYVTLTTDGKYTYNVGETIVVSGVTPTGYNGTYSIYSVTPTTITFASTTTGAMTVAGTVAAGDALSVISNNTRSVITPRSATQSAAVAVTTSQGSSFVTITASNSLVNNGDTVYIETPIAVGGLIIFGVYPCIFVDSNNFQISVLNSLGQPVYATSSVTSGGAVPSFAFASGTATVNVTLVNHGYTVGSTFTVLVSTTGGGVTLYGNYTVSSVVSTNVFQIIAQNQATSNATVSMNGGNAFYTYYHTPGPVPTGTGYGIGGYGIGGYGTGVVPSFGTYGNPITVTDWTLDNWGQIFVSCPVNGPIFTWSPTAGVTQASIIYNGPIANDGMFVAMPQRQIIAWGSTFNGIQDPLLIRWSDVGDYSTWIATVTNQAGSYRMPKGSKIVGCIQGPQQGLVWTDLGLYAMQYTGPPYVYQFNELGTGCGMVGRKAAASLNGIVYWMGQSQFFMLGQNGVQIVACPVWDVIFQDIDLTNANKIRVAANSYFGEIAWYYPTVSSGGEISAYVKYNVVLNQWDFGNLVRTAWINQSVLGPPIGAGPSVNSNYIYQHETSPDADGQAMTSNFQTGYFEISDAEYKVFVDQFWPDMKFGYYGGTQQAQLQLTFYVTDYPHENPRVYGPYAMNNQTDFITPRFRGRLMSIGMGSSDVGSFWRIGAPRYRLQPDGKF